MVTRGCGTRKKGGAYLVCGLSEKGLPIEDFVTDPPIPLDPELGVTPIGQTFVPALYELEVRDAAFGTLLEGEARDAALRALINEWDGDEARVTESVLVGADFIAQRKRKRPAMVFDWVGANDYPNVMDFVEETAHFGLSRRVRSNFDFSQIEPGTRIRLVHARAIIENAAEYQRRRAAGAFTVTSGGLVALARRACPKERGHTDAASRVAALHTQEGYVGMCAGLWLEDIEHGEPLPREGENPNAVGRHVLRSMPSFGYVGYRRPDDVRPEYAPGIFMTLPIQRVEVIADPDGGTHEPVLSRASAAGVPVRLCDE